MSTVIKHTPKNKAQDKKRDDTYAKGHITSRIIPT